MTLKTRGFYEFGSFRLEPAEHLLLRDRVPIPLPPKTFELLVFLVQNHSRLVTKEQIMQAVWQESFVEEANLTVSISALRRALGEKEESRYIETVPKRGYRFTASVREVKLPADVSRQPPQTSGQGPPTATAVAPATETRAAQAREKQPADEKRDDLSALLVAPQPRTDFVIAIPHAPEDLGDEKPRKRVIATVLLILLCALLGFTGYLRLQSDTASSSQPPRSLAVIPFQNVGQDASSDFLGFSLADAVITKLGYVSSLSVRPSSAVQQYRNQAIDIRKVGADLNVNTLLTGNYVRDGDNFRITPQLIDVKTEKILWRGTIDLKYDHLLNVQDNVAQQIIKGLELSLSPSQAEKLKMDEPVDPVAYEYYLRGVDLYSQNDFPMSIKMLEKSAQIGPNYALTWVYLGKSYEALASLQFGGRQQYDQAQAAFEKALSIEPGQIEAHTSMANLLTDTGSVEHAVPLLRDVLKTNPNLAEAHWELGYAYRFGGMLHDSVTECERARQLDPGVKLNSATINGYLYLGQYDKFLQSLPENSNSALVIFYRGFAEYYKNDWTAAAAEFDRAYQIDPTLLQAAVGKAYSYAIAHQDSKALGVLHATETKIEQRGVSDPEAIYKIAEAYAVLGDKSSAMHTLGHSIEKGFFAYPYLVSDPLLNNIRNQSGFAALLKMAEQRHNTFKATFF
jgi:DNA-binding winged helix-turn-helix (wHTH) protein/TolB-like protein/lipopolysaccharide biosynthesis regulator YciM